VRLPGVAVVPLDDLGGDPALTDLVPAGGAVLLRPDRVIFGTAGPRDVGALLDELASSAAFAGPGRR
jgi:hypothetical protein